MRRKPITLGERIVARIQRRGACWIWIGTYASDGYPVIEMNALATNVSVIPALWEHVNGPVPDGMVLVCTHPRPGSSRCVNPAHYRPRPAGNPKEACRNGHDLTNPDNLWVSPSTGQRFCLACTR